MYNAIDLSVFEVFGAEPTLPSVERPAKSRGAIQAESIRICKSLGDFEEGVIPFWKPAGSYGIYSQWFVRTFLEKLILLGSCLQSLLTTSSTIAANNT
jgi:hypothetical protein